MPCGRTWSRNIHELDGLLLGRSPVHPEPLQHLISKLLKYPRQTARRCDLLAMTWDLRSFQGPERIRKFLHDNLQQLQLHDFKLTFA